MSKMKLLHKILILCIILLVILLAGGGCGAYLLFAPNFMPEKTCHIYIYPEKNYPKLCRQLEDSALCRNIRTFRWLAEWLKYPESMKTGCYAVYPKMNNYDLLNNLRRGHQDLVKVTFNNIRMKGELADRLGEQLMLNGNDLKALLYDDAFCDSMGFTPQTIQAMFIPNTYEVYWNISAVKLMQRMQREYHDFWTAERRSKAEAIGVSPVEVAVLASIVEEETAVAEEYAAIAGLYINRLHRGMPLQADPTVKYALANFSLKRILYEHLNINSPYNTYLYTGLPPGPIRLPSISGIDAVLNYRKHNYLYMCAKGDGSGQHNFAVTLAEHNLNANRYRAMLDSLGIR
jgi:UPF0755 protein